MSALQSLTAEFIVSDK